MELNKDEKIQNLLSSDKKPIRWKFSDCEAITATSVWHVMSHMIWNWDILIFGTWCVYQFYPDISGWRYISEPLETPVKFGWKFKICINVFKSVRKIDARSREAGEHSNYRGREHFLHCTLIHGFSTFYHHLQLWTRRWLEPWRCAPAHLMNIVTWSSISDNLSLNIEIGQRIGKARFELITSRSRTVTLT